MIENLHAAYVNLDHRTDRNRHMQEQLQRAGIKAERVRGMLPHEYSGPEHKVSVMRKRSPGAIGCHYSQVSIMEKALELGKHAFVMEDDLIFCSDFQKRLRYIDEFTSKYEWDVIWLGGTVHINPPYWHTGRNPDLSCNGLGRDAELTPDPHMLRTFGCFSTYAYIVNHNSIDKILVMLDKHVHESMGIDWLFIKLQPHLFTFCFVPGCVKQMDNKSDIGKGWTIFSGFSKLNGSVNNSRYWWQDRMDDFNPFRFDWGEANNKMY
jgi:GR25 family glycosyltransferase involved in LPS biosynthesis